VLVMQEETEQYVTKPVPSSVMFGLPSSETPLDQGMV